MVFPVLRYRHKSWTIKEAESQKINAFEEASWILEKTLESLLDSKVIKLVNPKGNQPEYSLEGLMLKQKLQYFGHLMWLTDSLEKTLILGETKGRRRRGWQRMRRLDGITDSMDMSWASSGSCDGQGGLACCSLWGCKELETTEQLNWTVLFRNGYILF